MIKTLRRKFIAITMISIFVVLGGLMTIINIINYSHVNQNADERLAVLADNQGEFPRPEGKQNGMKHPPREMSPEAPFDTRYFTVTLRPSDGEVVAVNTGRIAAITTETATAYAADLYAREKTAGFLGSYKYRTVELGGDVMYIFLDCGRELSTFTSFLLASVLASLGGMLLVFVLVVIFSRMAVKPVAESVEKQKRFITDASHELKTPLTVIDASTEVLEMENGENEWTGNIREQVKRLTELTNKLVFLSRMDEEDRVLPMTDFSLSDAVAEAAQPFEAIASAQGKTLQLDIQQGLSYHGDESSLRQLVSLLLDNAMKYASDGGGIWLSLHATGRGRELLVWNPVDAIPQGKLDMLFERFYRLDNSRNSGTGGHGVGLSVAKAIVTAHKGKITARSDDGRSILFTVTL